jgi:hypothetical protein
MPFGREVNCQMGQPGLSPPFAGAERNGAEPTAGGAVRWRRRSEVE